MLFFLIVPVVLTGQQKQKIIFDCDLGSDIDDAFALGLILASPEFEVLGIVMDHGLTDKRAQVAAKMLYLTKRTDIPIFAGKLTRLSEVIHRLSTQVSITGLRDSQSLSPIQSLELIS